MPDPILSLSRNTQGRDFVVGDIHGEFSLLESALESISFDRERDRLICCGDLIDRGPESHRALEFLLKPWFYSVKGNHDEWAVRSVNALLEGEGLQTAAEWIKNGGNWMIHQDPDAMESIAEALDALPVLIEIDATQGRIGICHAEPPLGAHWEALKMQVERRSEKAIEGLLWDRHRIDHAQRVVRDYGALIEPQQGWGVDGIDHLFVGHSVVDDWLTLGNVHFIDTGSCFGGDVLLVNTSHASGLRGHTYRNPARTLGERAA